MLTCYLANSRVSKSLRKGQSHPIWLNESTGRTSEADGILTCGTKYKERGTKISDPELALAKQEAAARKLLTAEAECL